MHEVHQGLPMRNFVRPKSGIVDVTVCKKSGMLLTKACNEGSVTLPFLVGTQPEQECDIHGNRAAGFGPDIDINMLDADDPFSDRIRMPRLDLDIILSKPPMVVPKPNAGPNDEDDAADDQYKVELPEYNPLLD
jgi:penicillin-binding protein 1A